MAATDNEAVPTARYSPATLRGLMTSEAQERNSAATTAEQRDSSASTAATSQGFSRSTGLPARMGKATAELKTKVPDEVKFAFVQLAHSCDLTEAEFLRDMVILRLYGPDAVLSMQEKRLRMVAGAGSDKGPL